MFNVTLGFANIFAKSSRIQISNTLFDFIHRYTSGEHPVIKRKYADWRLNF